MSFIEFLDGRRAEILERFVRDVRRKELAPGDASTSMLVDHLPAFLAEISARLNSSAGLQETRDVEVTARQHGEQRLKAGYELEDVIREYEVLRRAILSEARDGGQAPTGAEVETLTEYLNLGVASAASQYARARESQLASGRADLQFLCEAGELLGDSLDYKSTLAKLTRLVVPRLADCCILNLVGHGTDELPIAHVDPEMVELVRDVLLRFQGAEAVPGHAGVLASGQSVLLDARAINDWERVLTSAEHVEVWRRFGPRSALVVPLRVKAESLGTMSLIWSQSDREYSASDLLLAEDLGRRASSAIDNARLFELARNERSRAEAATRTKDEFVAMVSHELRTPLNVIVGWLRLLRSGMVPEERRESALEVIERNANAQSQLVADLLDISRALTGRIRLEPAQVDLANLVDMVLEDARLALDAKRLVLHVDIQRVDAVMRGDADRLRQVVWSLLLNAVKFTPKGGAVFVRLCRIESDLELTVRDSGVGMTEDVLPHIFESFHQADSKTTRSHGGLGIGLSIAKYLVDLHGGSISAESEGPDKGSTFKVRLPITSLISSTLGVRKVDATAPRSHETEPFAGLAGVRALVVDDDEDARDLLRLVLESRGMIVSSAASVAEALDCMRAAEVDVLLSDIGMPGQDGYALIRHVRAWPEASRASIPAIALTAFAAREDRTRALLEGFNQHLAKPVAPNELLAAIADLVEHPPMSR